LWVCHLIPTESANMCTYVPADNEMFMDAGERVIVRVTGVRFHRPPTPAQQAAAAAAAAATATGRAGIVGGEGGGALAPLGTEARPFVPMEVRVMPCSQPGS
jgi:hypothetical protein